jgi:hypothetical protein
MDMARVWPIVMQFGIGGIMCVFGVWCGLRSGYLDLKYRSDRRMIGLIVAGYLGLLILVGLFTFWLPFVPTDSAK